MNVASEVDRWYKPVKPNDRTKYKVKYKFITVALYDGSLIKWSIYLLIFWFTSDWLLLLVKYKYMKLLPKSGKAMTYYFIKCIAINNWKLSKIFAHITNKIMVRYLQWLMALYYSQELNILALSTKDRT